jgi:hypothetical protein
LRVAIRIPTEGDKNFADMSGLLAGAVKAILAELKA